MATETEAFLQPTAGFEGEKLSLNFQDIEIRAVLQLLADFTEVNIVVSDKVAGNITIRLKDVPWRQALEVILVSRDLYMQENGNVIWVEPILEKFKRESEQAGFRKILLETELLALKVEYRKQRLQHDQHEKDSP